LTDDTASQLWLMLLGRRHRTIFAARSLGETLP